MLQEVRGEERGPKHSDDLRRQKELVLEDSVIAKQQEGSVPEETLPEDDAIT